MEIKVGEYVRTKEGVIGKITKVVTNSIFYVQFYDNEPWKTDIEEAGIVKSSPNIIDLIEVGDYVNGYLIDYIPDNEKAVYHDSSDCADVEKFENKDIETIVTKEQFKEMEYKV